MELNIAKLSFTVAAASQSPMAQLFFGNISRIVYAIWCINLSWYLCLVYADSFDNYVIKTSIIEFATP